MTAMPVTAPSQNHITSSKNQLKTDDFIKMMLTQLQDTLKGLTLQNQLGSAGNLIGKLVQGIDSNNDNIVGLVDSVRVENNQVFLELDSGKTLPMGNVIAIANAPPTSAPSAAAPLK